MKSSTHHAFRSAASAATLVLVDDEERRTFGSRRPVRFGVVRDLIAHPGGKLEAAAIGQLGLEPSRDAQQDMPLRAPVVGMVAWRVFDHSYAKLAEVPR